MVACSGDVISVSTNRTGAVDTELTWSQSWQKRHQKYYTLSYENITRARDSEHGGVIFVQQDMWDQFKNRCNKKGDLMEISVNSDFQYGQRKDGSRRFLVYHNRDQKPYQHRYIETALGSNLVNGGEKVAKFLGLNKGVDPAIIGNLAKDFTGDYLHNF